VKAPYYIAAVLLLEVVLGIAPATDRLTWALENAPVWIGAVAIGLTYRRFPLSRLCLVLLTLHAVILMVGGHYSYARVPLGNWLQDALGLARNHYDRIGHFAQGFVPAILVRELLIRRARMPRTGWLPFAVVMICLGFSAFYELVEWWTAIAAGDASRDFLGSQGDIWDAQWDMFLAGLGASLATLLLPRWHDRSLAVVAAGRP